MKKKFFLFFFLSFIISFSQENIRYNIIQEILTLDEMNDNFLEEKDKNTNNVSEDQFNKESIKSSVSAKTEKEKSPIFNKIYSDEPDFKTLNQEISRRDLKLEEMNDKNNRITALGSAMGAVDLGSTPAKKIRLGAGVGNSSSSQAVAVGVGYAPTENFRFNTKFSSSTNNMNNNSISVGASYDLDI